MKSSAAHCWVGGCQFCLATCQFRHVASRQKTSGMEQLHYKGAQTPSACQEDTALFFPLLCRGREKKALGLARGTVLCWCNHGREGRRKQPGHHSQNVLIQRRRMEASQGLSTSRKLNTLEEILMHHHCNLSGRNKSSSVRQSLIWSAVL